MKHEVSLYEKNSGLAEIYQDVQMKFAFCRLTKTTPGKAKVEQLHPWILCRDFLGDALFATHHKCGYGIYGFSWDGSKSLIPTDLTYLLIKHHSKEELLNNLKVIHHFEKTVRWKRTKIVDLNMTHSGKPLFLVISSKKWVSSTPLISLYTMLWRLSPNKIKEDETVDQFIERCSTISGNDGSYLKRIKDFQEKMGLKKHIFYTILKHNRTIFSDCYKYASGDVPGRVHNNNGILSLVSMANSFLTSPGLEPKERWGDSYSSALANVIKKGS